jgi:hypothetical protein
VKRFLWDAWFAQAEGKNDDICAQLKALKARLHSAQGEHLRDITKLLTRGKTSVDESRSTNE